MANEAIVESMNNAEDCDRSDVDDICSQSQSHLYSFWRVEIYAP
jgi:hypothetical protein